MGTELSRCGQPPRPAAAAHVPVPLKQRVAGEHDVEGRGLQLGVDVPLWRLRLGCRLPIITSLLPVYVKFIVCRGASRPGE